MKKKQRTAVDFKRAVINVKRYYGKHLMMTAKGCNERLPEVSTVSESLLSLVPRTDMTAYGELLVARFGKVSKREFPKCS